MTRADSMRRHPAGKHRAATDSLDRPASRGECAATVLIVLTLIAIVWVLTETLRAVT